MTHDEMKVSALALHGLLLRRPGRTTPGDIFHWASCEELQVTFGGARNKDLAARC